jgi:hypothetical protein
MNCNFTYCSSWVGTWSLILKEEYSERVFENRLLKSIFAPMRDEMTGG